MKKRLKIAVQKSGRLFDGSIQLLKECVIQIENGTNKLRAEARNFPIEVLYLRNSDIPQYIEDDVVHVGIIGENLVEEVKSEKKIEILKRLGFSKCRLSLAVPKNAQFEGVEFFSNKKIATSYPNSLKAFLKKNNVNAEIHKISGSVEIAPGIGLADGICDLVSTGSTLLTNGLKEAMVMLQSEAVLVKGDQLDPELQAILDRLCFRIDAVLTAKYNKYVLLNAPNEKIDKIINILPGMKSPTVLPLAKEGWSSVHSVINENDFWEIIDQLKDNGAEGILVVPIQKMIL